MLLRRADGAGVPAMILAQVSTWLDGVVLVWCHGSCEALCPARVMLLAVLL